AEDGIRDFHVTGVQTCALPIFTIWNSAYRRGTTGQTIGQKMVKIKTVSEQTGQPVGFGNAFLRELCHALDSLACYVGFLAPLWRSEERRVGERWTLGGGDATWR